MLSCILPTQPTRFAFAQRAILDFVAMRKESTSTAELLLVTGDAEYAARLRGFLSGVRYENESEILVLYGKHTRGIFDCLTYGLTVAAGKHVSFWDDADKHSKRWLHFLSYWARQSPKSVIVPTKTLYHFYETRETYVCDFHDENRPLAENAILSNVVYPRRALPQMQMTLREDPYAEIFKASCKISHPVFPDHGVGPHWLHMVGVANDEQHDRHRANVQRQTGVVSRTTYDAIRAELMTDLSDFYGDLGRSLDLQVKDGHVDDYEYSKLEQCYPGSVLTLPKYATESKESESDGEVPEKPNGNNGKQDSPGGKEPHGGKKSHGGEG